MSRRGRSYFFLSYAHSPPLAGGIRATPDRWVRRFFADLTKAVGDRAARDIQIAPGFFDQDTPPGSDWKEALTAALSTAEVFVPLYSPGYFARSWPGREWACYKQRLVSMGFPDPQQRFVPVLWTPTDDWQNRDEVPDPFAGNIGDAAYAKNGLQALLRLTLYQESYEMAVGRIAERIVELAEREPLEPSAVPDIDRTDSAFQPDRSMMVFTVAVAAPVRADAPATRQQAYGDLSTDWRPYYRDQEMSLASSAAWVAEQLDFAALMTGIEDLPRWQRTGPGVVLIDPWFIADEDMSAFLDRSLRHMPSWILPLLVLDSDNDARSRVLARQAKVILDNAVAIRTEPVRRAIHGVRSLAEFVTLMPILVTEAERQFLRNGPITRSTAPPGARPLLVSSGSADRPVAPHPIEETPDV